jgi:hypothetical protein
MLIGLTHTSDFKLELPQTGVNYVLENYSLQCCQRN